MKKTISLLAVAYFFLTAPSPVYAGFFHANEVSTSWNFTKGYEDNDAVYFLLNYCLYQRPVGIARFPDGGTSKILYNKTYLYRWQADQHRLSRLALLDTRERGNSISWSTRMSAAEDTLRIGYHGCGFIWDMARNQLTPVPENETEIFFQTNFPEKRKGPNASPHDVNISRLKKELSGLPFTAWELPSPLEYCKKSNNAYTKDLVRLNGDKYYRYAIIDKLKNELTNQQIRQILKKMDEREMKLLYDKQMEYKILSAETREKLKAIISKNSSE